MKIGKFSSLAKQTKKSNAEFAKMDAAQQRVTIAKDVIKALAAKQLIAEAGTYLAAPKSTSDAWHAPKSTSDAWHNEGCVLDDQDQEAQLQQLLPKLPPCHVCAKGAILVCTVARRNELQVDATRRGWDGDTLADKLGGIFSPDTLTMMECEFEGFSLTLPTAGPSYTPRMNLRGSDAKRMKAIMRNIIKNKGEFVPVAP
jgi:hypothetical protein